MKRLARFGSLLLACWSLGCGHLEFVDFQKGEGLTYYEPMPYLFLVITPECVTTANVIVLPGEKRTLKFVSGLGSTDLSVSVSNGMLTAVGQKTDTKIPETIGAIASLAGGAVAARAVGGCTPTATLYSYSFPGGELRLTEIKSFPIQQNPPQPTPKP